MKCIDLFAGAGGLSEGFTRAGFDVVAHVENDYPASLTLKTRIAYNYHKENGTLNIYKDYLLKKITRAELYETIPADLLDRVINQAIGEEDEERDIFKQIDKILDGESVDIIIGGPPCQAYSLIGRARDPFGMANDKRNFLYQGYLRFLKKYRPKMFLFENVKGIITAQKGEVFPVIKKGMEELGYHVEHKTLNAKDFGVPQSRERVIIVGWRKEYDLHYPDANMVESSFSVDQVISGLPKLKAGMKYKNQLTDVEPSVALRELGIAGELNVITQHVARPHIERDLTIYRKVVDVWNKERRRLLYTELPKELQNHKNKTSFLDRYKVVDSLETSHTLVAHLSKDGHYFIHPDIKQNRSITVREAARLQTFPDDFYFESSRTSAYKQIGNAVPPFMAYKLAEEVRKTMEEELHQDD